MDVISVLKVIDQIKKTQSCTASVLCRIGCILEYLLGLLKKNDESDQKVIKDLSDLKEVVDKANLIMIAIPAKFLDTTSKELKKYYIKK